LRSGTSLGCRQRDGEHATEHFYQLRRRLRLAIQHPNGSDAGSEEDNMSNIVLLSKATKLMKLCEAEGFDSLDDLLVIAVVDSVCPAICMTEGCDHTTEMEPDQTEGYCDACGGNTVISVLVLAGLI
jgi:hypothetical protein